MPTLSVKKSLFDKQKYVKNICELLMEDYNINKNTAMNAINRSGLLDSLQVSPELTSHIPDEAWAQKIWEGYRKNKI